MTTSGVVQASDPLARGAPPADGAGPSADEPEKQRTLLVSVSATFLVLATYTLPLSTLSHTAQALQTEGKGQAWILSAMSVGLGAALLASGAVADSRGRRRVFVGGAILLSVASIFVALAQNTLGFVLFRGLQGVGGAALTSCSLGLLGHAFPAPAQRARATGWWGASLGAGIAAGPLLGASLDALSGWRAGYWLTAALSALLAIVAAAFLTESRSDQPRPADYLGTALLMSGLSGLLASLVEARSGWRNPTTLGLLGGSLFLLLAFVASQAFRPAAMLDLALLRRADFIGATLGALANGLGVIALMIFVPSLIERGLGHSPLTAALALLTWSGVSVLSALFARRLPPAVTARRQMVFALLGVALGQLALGGLSPDSHLGRLLPGLAFAGVASGFLNAALARQAVASVPQGSASIGSGANNTARYVGAAVGMTVVVTLAGRPTAAALVAGWNLAVPITAAFSLLGALAVFLCRWESRAPELSRAGPVSPVFSRFDRQIIHTCLGCPLHACLFARPTIPFRQRSRGRRGARGGLVRGPGGVQPGARGHGRGALAARRGERALGHNSAENSANSWPCGERRGQPGRLPGRVDLCLHALANRDARAGLRGGDGRVGGRHQFADRGGLAPGGGERLGAGRPGLLVDHPERADARDQRLLADVGRHDGLAMPGAGEIPRGRRLPLREPTDSPRDRLRR